MHTRSKWLVAPIAGGVLAVLQLSSACGSDENVNDTATGGTGGADSGSGGSSGSSGSSGSGGSSGSDAGSDAAGDGGIEWPNIACDPLVPSYCGFPFPSNVHTVADPNTITGRRVSFKPDMFPVASNGNKTLPDPWAFSDGFSSGGALLAHFPGVTLEGVPTPLTIDLSTAADSPTVVLDAESGERVPHFAELDVSGTNDEERTFMIRPVVRLADARRYIVAIRKLEGASGALEPSPAFKALRDDQPFAEDASIEARRGLYDDIFSRLQDAGVGRSDLQLAWDFTTASRENNTNRMLHMRDEALELVGDDGPSYVIDSVDSDIDPANIAFRIHGRMTVPLYLDDPAPGGKMVFGSDFQPEPNPSQPTYEVPFEVLIPLSAATDPAALIQYGHGLLGSRSQIESSHFRSFMNEYNYIFFAVDLAGMSGEDVDFIGIGLISGELHRLSPMFDRLHQGMLNYLLAMRMMSRGFAKDATYGKYVDPSERYYHGISQGGIFGGMYMGLTTDVTRGLLCVMGQSYNLLLNRSVDFDPFFQAMNLAFPDARDQQLGLGATQMLWDRAEPNGYTAYIRENLLPNTPAHEVLMRSAIGDHQVTTLGAHVMARAVGARHLDTKIRDIYGLEKVESATDGSTYVEYDFDMPPEPICNVPNRACDDPHGKVRSLEEARKQMNEFLRTGRTTNYCTAGKCSFPALNGCAPNEPATPCGG
jgi:hypothetical protein